MSEPADALADVEMQWRRLDPRMLLIHPVNEAIRFLPALLGIFILGRASDGDGGNYWEWAALVIVVALGVMRYFTTRFRIENDQIELRKGLFTKQVIATPADRVRTVDVTAPPLHRLLGLAKVEIGTAGSGKERLVLDSVRLPEARRLREELIHRRNLAIAAEQPPVGQYGAQTPATDDPGYDVLPAGTPYPLPPPPADQTTVGQAAEDSTTLVALDPSWVRYAPLTMSGFLSALAILGFGNQLIRAAFESAAVSNAVGTLGRHTWWVDLLAGLVTLVVVVSVLAVIGYLLQFWGFRLTRHRGGTLHVTRGLLTTRETSIEEKRLRGAEVGEPLGLRLASGSRLRAITTGLSRREDDRGSAWLVPPAPRAVVDDVARQVVGDTEALTAPLTPHGPAARRRRTTRAVVPSLLFGPAVLAIVLWAGFPVGVAAVGFVPLVAAPFIARDRYDALGHHLSADHLVVRSGSFNRRRDVLQRNGIIGFTLRSTFFQRHAGVTTLVATTAAGKQSYSAYDLSPRQAVAVAHEIDPGLVEQFLAH